VIHQHLVRERVGSDTGEEGGVGGWEGGMRVIFEAVGER
jgi:hypothetical protein